MTRVLITGSTDGIGLETAKHLATAGHHVIVHGRNPGKVDAAVSTVRSTLGDGGVVEHVVADLSRPTDVAALADEISSRFESLDVLINNAGVFRTPEPVTADGLDVRFAVNTIAPYLLTRRLLPIVGADGRIVNLSSAAQAPVDLSALSGERRLDDGTAYAQSKLALTMWSRHLADELGTGGPVVVAVNPGSLLATKMVKEGYGMDGKDINIGSGILVRASVSEEFASATGLYFDNDSGRFAPPHTDALNVERNRAVVERIEGIIAHLI